MKLTGKGHVLVQMSGLASVGSAIEVPNTVIYTGADLVAQALASSVYINRMYFEYMESAVDPTPYTPPAVDTGVGITYYLGLDGVTADFMRVPIVAVDYDATASGYTNNRVLFMGVFPTSWQAGMTGVRGLALAATSWVRGVALAYAPVANDPSQDTVYARAYPYTGSPYNGAVQYTPGTQMFVRWPVTFTVEPSESSSSSSSSG